MIKAIVFDWGNVIENIDSETFIKKMSKEFNVSPEKFKEIELKHRLKHDLGQINTEKFIMNLNKELKTNVSLEKYYYLMKKWKIMTLNKELIILIKKLKKEYKIFLLSNNSPPTLEKIKKIKLNKYFDKMLFSFQIKLKKPNPKFFIELLKNTNITSKDCLIIDDREDICKSAKIFGMNYILFKNNKQLQKELKKFNINV